MARFDRTADRAAMLMLVVAGCGSKNDPPPLGSAAPITTSVASGSSTSARSAVAPNASASSTPRVLEKTAVPTFAEWTTAPDAAIAGAEALGCEVKTLREWFRVSCRTVNDTGGVPTSVKVEKGEKSGESFVFTSKELTSWVARFMPGTEMTARFTWSDKEHVLHMVWPSIQDRPSPLGVFVGASTKHVEKAERAFLCECYKHLYGSNPNCEGMNDETWAPECVRAHPDDCNRLLECQTYEPSGYAQCIAGEAYFGACPTCRCAKVCKTKADCKPDQDCADNWRGENVCQ